ncbi:hypothetical protein GW916_00355, partial [bacterium]|nr:hypothetical protein [bacterium]
MSTYVREVPDTPFDWNNEGAVTSTVYGLSQAASLVTARFNATLATAEEMLARLVGVDGNSGYLGTLASIITDYNVPGINIASTEIPDLSVTPDSRPLPDLTGL